MENHPPGPTGGAEPVAAPYPYGEPVEGAELLLQHRGGFDLCILQCGHGLVQCFGEFWRWTFNYIGIVRYA